MSSNFDTATANLTDAQKKEAKFQLDQNEYIQQYNEARSAETGLKADLTNAQVWLEKKVMLLAQLRIEFQV